MFSYKLYEEVVSLTWFFCISRSCLHFSFFFNSVRRAWKCALHCNKTVRGISATLTGWSRSHRSWKWKMIVLHGQGICPLTSRYHMFFPHFFKTRNFPEISMVIGLGSPLHLLVYSIPRCRKKFPEFSGELSCEKTEVCAQGGIDLWSSDNYSTPFPLDHGYLLWINKLRVNIIMAVYYWSVIVSSTTTGNPDVETATRSHATQDTNERAIMSNHFKMIRVCWICWKCLSPWIPLSLRWISGIFP